MGEVRGQEKNSCTCIHIWILHKIPSILRTYTWSKSKKFYPHHTPKKTILLPSARHLIERRQSANEPVSQASSQSGKQAGRQAGRNKQFAFFSAADYDYKHWGTPNVQE